MNLISKAEYARMRGVSAAAVTRAIKDGRITTIHDRIDPDVADLQWDKNSRVRAGSVGAGAQTAGDSGSAGSEPGVPSSDSKRYQDARVQREQALADIAALDLAERRGELVRLSEWERALTDKVIVLRDALESLSDRLAPILAAEADQATVYRILRDEHRKTLAAIVGQHEVPERVDA